nr:DinB family protein [Nocardioidaceae bacterium]
EGETFPVRECLLIVLNEEWWHRQYAERDLSVLEERA